MAFLERFLQIADSEGIPERQRLYLFGSCLKENSAVWWKLKMCQTFTEAVLAFRDRYWDEDTQMKAREEIAEGKYLPVYGQTMADYAAKKIVEARYLTPPMPTRQLLNSLLYHFPQKYFVELRRYRTAAADEFVAVLKDLETLQEISKYKRQFVRSELPNTSKYADWHRKQQVEDDRKQITFREPAANTGERSKSPQEGRARYQSPSPSRSYDRTRECDNSSAEERGRRAERSPNDKKGRSYAVNAIDRTHVDECNAMTKENEVSSYAQKDQPNDRVWIPLYTREDGRVTAKLAVCSSNQQFNINALIDTGTTTSVVSKEFLKESVAALIRDKNIPTKQGYFRRIKLLKTKLKDVFLGRDITATHKVHIPFRVKDVKGKTLFFSQDMIEVSGMRHDVILGIDFLTLQKAEIKFFTKNYYMSVLKEPAPGLISTYDTHYDGEYPPDEDKNDTSELPTGPKINRPENASKTADRAQQNQENSSKTTGTSKTRDAAETANTVRTQSESSDKEEQVCTFAQVKEILEREMKNLIGGTTQQQCPESAIKHQCTEETIEEKMVR